MNQIINTKHLNAVSKEYLASMVATNAFFDAMSNAKNSENFLPSKICSYVKKTFSVLNLFCYEIIIQSHHDRIWSQAQDPKCFGTMKAAENELSTVVPLQACHPFSSEKERIVLLPRNPDSMRISVSVYSIICMPSLLNGSAGPGFTSLVSGFQR